MSLCAHGLRSCSLFGFSCFFPTNSELLIGVSCFSDPLIQRFLGFIHECSLPQRRLHFASILLKE